MNTYLSHFSEVIPTIKDRNYWFVRTDSGHYFEDFYENGYIAIGWNYLTLDAMSSPEKDVDHLKRRIAVMEGLSIDDIDDDSLSEDELSELSTKLTNNKRNVTKIFNKVNLFVNDIKQGDIVVIPSSNSSYIAIGMVSGNIYEDTRYIDEFGQIHFTQLDFTAEYMPCPYIKRFPVIWYKKINKNGMDIYLQSTIKAQQAIFPLNDHADYIDRNIMDIYFKNDILHSIIRTNQDGDITLSELKLLIDFIYDGISQSNDDINCISPDDVHIKLNIHSPGIIEILGIGIPSIIGLITLFAVWSVHRNGGKVTISGKGGRGFSFETKGSKTVEIENARLEIIKNAIQGDNANEKMKTLEKLNLHIPDLSSLIDEPSDSSDD